MDSRIWGRLIAGMEFERNCVKPDEEGNEPHENVYQK